MLVPSTSPHCFHGFSNCYRAPVKVVSKIVSTASAAFGEIQENPDALLNGLELVQSGFSIVEHVKKIPNYFAKFNLSWNAFGYAFYALRLPFYYFEYFLHSAQSDTIPSILGNVLYFFSDVGAIFQWFNEIKLIDLGRLSASFGKISVLKHVARIPLGGVVNGFCGAACAFFAVDALIRLSKGTLSRRERIVAWLDVVGSIMQIALTVLFFAGCTSFIPLIALGVVSGSISLLAFCFRYGNLKRASLGCSSASMIKV